MGNAYADEALFEAGILPFKRRKAPTEEEIGRLYAATPRVLYHAIAVLSEYKGGDRHKKVRDFLQVHGKRGSRWLRRGGNISAIAPNQRLTTYCRHCQPRMLTKN